MQHASGTKGRRPADPEQAPASADNVDPRDPLLVRSVEKAFRVLHAFSPEYQNMSLSQVAAATGLDMSAAQRFTHTLVKLGYLRRDRETKRFELTTRTLDLGYSYIRASTLVERTVPYIMHLSKATEETVSLTVLDGTEIVYIACFVSRNMLNTDVIVGTRLPAYCTAPGIAILSRMAAQDARGVLDRSDLRSYTPQTTWRMADLQKKNPDRARARLCHRVGRNLSRRPVLRLGHHRIEGLPGSGADHRDIENALRRQGGGREIRAAGGGGGAFAVTRPSGANPVNARLRPTRQFSSAPACLRLISRGPGRPAR